MSRSRSPVRFSCKVKINGEKISLNSDELAGMKKLNRLIKSKLEARVSEKAIKQKRLDEEKEAEKQELLQLVKKVFPTAFNFEYEIYGSGFTEMGRNHKFYLPRDEIDFEFDTKYFVSLGFDLPSPLPGFDTQIGLEYRGSQTHDAGDTQVSFEMNDDSIFCNFYLGDFECIPTSREAFKAMLEELLTIICPDRITRDIVCKSIDTELPKLRFQ